MNSRRQFLGGLLAAGLCPHPTWADAGAPSYLSAARDSDGGYFLAGLNQNGAIVFKVPLTGRGHAATAHPTRPEAVAFARRPGIFAIVIDCRDGRRIAELTTPPGRHFYGHGTFSSDGQFLFTTENDFDGARGFIGIWDVGSGYERIGEIPSHGIGPHDIALRHDPDCLVIANGGIETHPDSGRAKLNIATMQPNLSYASTEGELLDQIEFAGRLRKNSIRHLAVRSDGMVGFAMQWQGDLAVCPPLAGLHKIGGSVHLLDQKNLGCSMQGYAGSIAFSRDGRHLAITSPRGGVMRIFEASTKQVSLQHEISDVCGVAAGLSGFFATSGTGLTLQANGRATSDYKRHNCQWDNHLVAI